MPGLRVCDEGWAGERRWCEGFRPAEREGGVRGVRELEGRGRANGWEVRRAAPGGSVERVWGGGSGEESRRSIDSLG